MGSRKSRRLLDNCCVLMGRVDRGRKGSRRVCLHVLAYAFPPFALAPASFHLPTVYHLRCSRPAVCPCRFILPALSCSSLPIWAASVHSLISLVIELRRQLVALFAYWLVRSSKQSTWNAVVGGLYPTALGSPTLEAGPT